jgi:hypothetical protein
LLIHFRAALIESAMKGFVMEYICIILIAYHLNGINWEKPVEQFVLNIQSFTVKAHGRVVS